MDARPEVLAEEVRAKRLAVENDLELLRVRMEAARRIDTRRWARTVAPVAAAAAAVWLFARRRRAVRSLDQLLVKELSDLYAIERALVPALERMSLKASSPDVKHAFDQHRLETAGHVERLRRVFQAIGARPRHGSAAAVATAIKEAERLLKRRMDSDVRDAWLIASAQRIEHLEIAKYGTARTFAQTLGHTAAAQLLQETLDEEYKADQKLTGLAERYVNPSAA